LDFVENISPVQKHRRLRALKRLKPIHAEHAFRSTTISMFDGLVSTIAVDEGQSTVHFFRSTVESDESIAESRAEAMFDTNDLASYYRCFSFSSHRWSAEWRRSTNHSSDLTATIADDCRSTLGPTVEQRREMTRNINWKTNGY
jgi:hypothetical protein